MTHANAPAAIAVRGLRKSYGDQVVLDGVDLEVDAGTICALLGPNGAGKTTMVSVLTTLIRADGGDIRVAGYELPSQAAAVRGVIGVTGQFSAVDKLLTGEENLLLMADLLHLGRTERRRRTAELLDQFGLADAARQDGRNLLGRHAAAPGPGDDAGRASAHHLPGRTDRWTGPAQQAGAVGDSQRAQGGWRHHLPHHAVPGRSRPPRRPDRPAGPRAAGGAGHGWTN